MSLKNLGARLAEKLLDQVVDVHNFKIREPYKKVVSKVAKDTLNAAKDSRAVKFIEQEPNIKKIKKVLTPKVKVIPPEQITMKSELYSILGIAKSSNDEEIKAAFKKLAKTQHPDRSEYENKDEIFKAIQRAFTILSDSNKRKYYDDYGFDSLKPGFNPESM